MLDNTIFRLSLLYSSSLCLVLIIIMSGFYWVSVRIPLGSLETELRQEQNELLRTYRSGGSSALVKELTARREAEAERLPFDALIGADGALLTGNLPSWPRAVSSDLLSLEADLYVEGQEEDREALVIDHQFDDGTRLLLGRNIEDLDDIRENVAAAAAAFLPVLAVLAIVGALFMSRVVGGRIHAMDIAAQRIMGNRMSERLPVAGTNDDLDQLAQTLNQMLARLEATIDGLRHTSDSVAHELRTPLARLQSYLEEMRESESAPPDNLAKAIKEVEALGNMFDVVLTVTRLERGHEFPEMQDVDLSKLLYDAAEIYECAATGKDIEFRASIPANITVHGNANLLFQATCNLLDNALKFTPRGGHVFLDAANTQEGTVVTVTDSGPGIPENLHELVVQRFYRAPSAKKSQGLGMGLPFVAAVNSIHGATLKFHSAAEGGLRVEWRMHR